MNRQEDVHGVKNTPSVESLPLPGFEKLIEDASTVQKIHRDGAKNTPEFGKEFNLFWDAYPIKVNKRDALGAFMALRKRVPLEEISSAFIGYMGFLKYQRVERGFDQAPMYPATFLRKDRWREYVGYKYKARL